VQFRTSRCSGCRLQTRKFNPNNNINNNYKFRMSNYKFRMSRCIRYKTSRCMLQTSRFSDNNEQTS